MADTNALRAVFQRRKRSKAHAAGGAPERPGRYRVVALPFILLTACLLLVACDPLGSDGAARNGTLIPGTGGIDCTSFDQPILVNPEARWGVFWLAADRPPPLGKAVATPVNRMALVDLETLTVHVPQGQPPPPSSGLGYPGLYGVCWRSASANGLQVHDYTRDQWYRVDYDHPDDLLRVEPDANCDAAIPPQDQWTKSQSSADGLPVAPGVGGLHVAKPTPDSITLTLDDGRVLAKHKSRAIVRRSIRVFLDAYAWSPNGQWLAYKISSMGNNFTAGPRHSYIVPRTGTRKPVAIGNTLALTWAGDDLLLACVNVPIKEVGVRNAIHYWRMPD